MAHFATIKEVSEKLEDKETLCLQLGIFHYGDGSQETRFRFIRRDKDGKQKAQRGQAGIPSLSLIVELASRMKKQCVTEINVMSQMIN